MGIGAAIGGVASLAGGLFGSSAAEDAGQAQIQAAQIAAAQSEKQYQQTRSDLGGYRDLGAWGSGLLQNRLGDLTAPWQPTQAQLEATPGYQFTLSQGLKSVQNSAAARGLGISGAALKGAANYATGLADSTWQNVFNADQTQKTNAYNKLFGIAGLGENAAAMTGNAGLTATGQANNALMSGANAYGASTLAGNNALMNGVNGAANNLMTYGYLNRGSGGLSGLFSGSSSSPYAYGAGGYTGEGPFMG